MRRILLVVGLVLIASSAFAQSPFGYDPGDPQTWFKLACPRCGVAAYLDVPAFGETLSRTDLLLGNVQFQGWGFECVSGQPVNRVDVFIETDQLLAGGVFAWKAVPQGAGALQFSSIARPDVAEAYTRQCPNVSGSSGWTLRLTSVPDWALGARRIGLVVWFGVYHSALVRTYNITR